VNVSSLDDPTYESRLEKLAAEVEYPEAWMPEPGDTLVGETLRWETVTVKRDDGAERPCEVLTVRDQHGAERPVWTWHIVLQNELIGKVEPGDFIAIHYRGRRAKLKGEGDYAAYRVAIEKADKPSPEEDGIPY
jgi:hypothetical protein